jgi:hypothetical protein
MKKELCVICPHCNETILIQKIQCGIFRHGVIKKTNKPIPPHTNKKKCDKLIMKREIYGCGKPFSIQIIENENEEPTIDVKICDYI